MIIKTTATMVVSLVRKVAAPPLPKTVWLDPPKAAPMLAPLPVWSRTIIIRAKQTSIWIITVRVVMLLYWLTSLIRAINLSGFRLAPPTRAPSMSGSA